MQRLKIILRYLFLLACVTGFLLLGWQQNTSARPSEQATHAVKLVKVKKSVEHTDKLSSFSPDKTYKPGDLVIKGGAIYEVQARPYGGH